MGYTPPPLEVRKVAGGWTAYPTGVTTDDFTILPNSVDTYPNIKLNGATGIEYKGMYHSLLNESGTPYIVFDYTDPDVTLTPYANKNLSLVPSGTGFVKFGTRTATGDAASNGHITILDAAGNTVKLMTTA